MTKTNWLPKALRWVFTALMGMTLVVGAVILFLIVNPSVFYGHETVQIGPVMLAPAPGAMTLKSDTGETISIDKLSASVSMKPSAGEGLAKLVTRRALPLALVYIAFFAFLFDMLRRLFRNVARAESFTDHNVRLVRLIGYSILVFSIAAAVAEGWVERSFVEYLQQHTSVASLHMHVIQARNFQIDSAELPFQWSWFLSGLLVLALSEVFRQGLALRKDSELTI